MYFIMKTFDIFFRLTPLTAIVLFFFACEDGRDINIVGKWKIENIKPIEGVKNDNTDIGLINLVAGDYKENIISFSDDNSFVGLNKNGEVFQKGTFELLDNNIIVLSIDNGGIEKYKLLENREILELTSDKVIITLKPDEKR